MTFEDFQIGQTFFTGAGPWRCTDKGTRTICAIKLDKKYPEHFYVGPPYAVHEACFSEDDFAGCHLGSYPF